MVSEPWLWPSGIFRHSSVALAFTISHCLKRVNVVTPNHYLSDLVYSSTKSSNHSHDVIDQTTLIKTQPKTVKKELPHTLTRCPKFLPVTTHATAQSYAPSHVLMHLTHLTRHTHPHAILVTSTLVTSAHINPITSALVTSASVDFDRHRWPRSKIFKRAYLTQFFT